MSQRYLPTSRDRSPSRQFDRRSSSSYTPLNTSSSYRPSNDTAQPSVDRPPPRGPRADSFRGGNFTFGSAPRGRGGTFAPRGADSWDRDRDRDRERDRDIRPQPSTFRRDEDRPEWSRRDDRTPTFNRDRPYVGRERSASPTRPRRDSKESIVPTFTRQQEPSSAYFGPNTRGGSDRGRGRGGWDRSRGRSSFIGELDRDLFPNRSRSREGWRDREFDRGRTFTTETDRVDRFERRDYDRSVDRDPRSRDHDIWPRDPSPGRSSAGNRAASPGALSSISQDRKLDYEVLRKPLTSSALQSRDTRRDIESDYFGSRNEGLRREPTFPLPSSAQNIPPSASLGLDYGPPPSAPASTALVSTNEKPPPAAKVAKPEPNIVTSDFQPPSGPKADRAASSNFTTALSPFPGAQTDTRAKLETSSRHRPSYTESQGATSNDVYKVGQDTVNERHVSTFLSNVPSGPRLGSGVPYKPRTSPVVQQTSLPTTQLKSTAPEPRSIQNAPTGPRNASAVPPSGPRGSVPTGPASTQNVPPAVAWRRPQVEYRPQKPSIMANISRPHITDRPPVPSISMAAKQSPKVSSSHPNGADRTIKTVEDASDLPSGSKSDAQRDSRALSDIEMSAPVSEDEDADEEPESELDENDFADSEKKHTREMLLLKAKKPSALLEDPHVIRLLIRLQLLEMMIEGLVPDSIQALKEEKDTEMSDRPVEGMPSPEESPNRTHSPPLEHPKPRGRPLKEPRVYPIPTPPIDDLPFLNRSSPQLIIFEEPVEDEVEEEKMTTLLRTQFEHDAWEEKDDLLELSDYYRQKYPEWKYEIDKYERMRKELEATPDPGSPGAQSSVSIPPSVERPTGRAARNATEFDIEKAILMSQQSAREEEERREREAASNAKPNYDFEAVVPPMLKPMERDLSWRFQDTNSFVPTNLSVELMQYIPPEDDFTEEEQSKFITAFCQTPKKWGLIADYIPERSYQDCIAHYYLTKNEAHYKDKWRRSQPKRKRGRAAIKPRSTALLSADMVLNEENDSTPGPVTDSGRPRRAAAPTFGETTDAEGSNLLGAKRLAMGPKDATDSTSLKASKGRKAGTATKIRRTKAQILADTQALALQASVEGTTVKGSAGRPRTLLRADNAANKIEVNMPMAALETTQVVNLAAPVNTAPLRQRSPPPTVVTSYWSVPEQQKFRQLVKYFGRDYAKIADFMKTKSQAMIKNQYTREIGKGDKELENFAQAAEERTSRGESFGKPPSPIAPPKRKYDPGPPTAGSSRPITANVDATLDQDRILAPAKGSIVDDFPSNAIHRDANGSVVAKASPRSDLMHHSPLHLPLQSKVEESSRDRPLLAQKGPPRGHFTDDSLFPHGQQRSQHVLNEHAMQPRPPQLLELRSGDLPAVQTRDLLTQPRDQVIHNQSGLQVPQYRGLESERGMPASRSAHSRNTSLTGPGSSYADPRYAELLSMQLDKRRKMAEAASTQSPMFQATQPSVDPRAEAFPVFPPQQPSQQQALKQEPLKPVPTKRSNVFGLLNDDEDLPRRQMKRLSSDTTSRLSVPTPPPPPPSSQPQPQYQHSSQDDLTGRPGQYGGGSQLPNHSNVSELRAIYSNSPIPSPHGPNAWIERFDPRTSIPERASNQSPHFPVVPPAPSSSSKTHVQSPQDSFRSLEPNGARRGNLGRSQMSSPPRQTGTPVPSFRAASAASHPTRMSSLGFGQSLASGTEPRTLQQTSQPPHVQPLTTHSSSAGGTPTSSLHQRGQHSVDYGRRSTIQEHMAQIHRDQPRDQRELEHIQSREELMPRGQHEVQHRQIGPPPPVAQGQDLSRATSDHRDFYRSEPLGHQVPPPPSRAPPLGHLNSSYGGPPPRTFSGTPPGPYGNDHRSMAGAHNQHAHHHHQSISSQHQQPPPQQGLPPQNQTQAMHHHRHHLLQQPQQSASPHGPPQQGHPGLGPHGHQSQPQSHTQQQPPAPQYREQPRFGQPGPAQGLAPPANSSHYRGYSQGGDERR